jgi:hypothetical protein
VAEIWRERGAGLLGSGIFGSAVADLFKMGSRPLPSRGVVRVSQLQDRQPDRVALEQSSCRAPPIRGGRVLS